MFQRLCAVVRLLDGPAARRSFPLLIGLAFVSFGAVVVTRAELPKRKHVERLHYDSPLEIDRRGDDQADYYSSEFRGFTKQSWGVIVEKLDPYDPAYFHVRAYPPFFNIVIFPFAVPWRVFGLGSALFYTASFVLAVLSAWWLSRWVETEHRFGAFLLVLILMAPLAANVMARCETDVLVLAPLAVSMMWLARGRRRFRAGFLLGLAASFKVLPGLFAVYLACRRRWSALAGMVASGVLCTVLLPVLVFGPARAWKLHVSWYRNVVAPYHVGGAESVIGSVTRGSNQSLTGAFQRYLLPVSVKVRRGVRCRVNVASLSPSAVRRIVKVVQGAVALGMIVLWLVCARREERPAGVAVLFASVAPAILLLSEISLTTHHLLLILPLSAIVLRACALNDARARRWTWLVPLYVAGLVGVAIPHVKILTPLLPVTLALVVGCAGLAVGDRFYALGPGVCSTSSA